MSRIAASLLIMGCLVHAADDRLVFNGKSGPGKGKRIVLISGDEEYRSEQALPQLAKILSGQHGFDCTVLFALDPDGTINPTRQDNIPGLEAVDSADLVIMLMRFRDLPDSQMKHLVDYVEAGRPIVGLRTATHAFELKTSPTYRRYSWNSKEWDGGFGRQVLGETWINHHGRAQSPEHAGDLRRRGRKITRSCGESGAARSGYRRTCIPSASRCRMSSRCCSARCWNRWTRRARRPPGSKTSR